MYGLAFIGGWIEQFGALFENQTAVKIGIITSLIIPSEALWRRHRSRCNPRRERSGCLSLWNSLCPSVLMIIYAVLYLS